MKEAWTWPSRDDLPCCLSRKSTYQPAVMGMELEHQEYHQASERGTSPHDVLSYDPRSSDAVNSYFFSKFFNISFTE